jgi:hypothetical protein
VLLLHNTRVHITEISSTDNGKYVNVFVLFAVLCVVLHCCALCCTVVRCVAVCAFTLWPTVSQTILQSRYPDTRWRLCFARNFSELQTYSNFPSFPSTPWVCKITFYLFDFYGCFIIIIIIIIIVVVFEIFQIVQTIVLGMAYAML